MIGRKSFLVYLNHISGAVTGAIGMFFIARFMTAPSYNYGIVSFALGFVGLFSFIGQIFHGAHVKRVSEGKDEDSCMGAYISLVTVSVVIMLGITMGSIFVWKYIMGRGFESSTHETVVYIILTFTAIKLLANIGMKTFQARSEIAKVEIIRFMDYNVPVMFIILVSVTGGQAIELAYAYMTGGLLMAFASVYFLRPVKIKKPDWSLVRSYWNFGIPYFFSRFTSLLGKQLDIVMVQLFWGSIYVGYYAVSLRFSAMVTGISTAVAILIFPTISGHHANSDWKSIRDIVTSSSRYLSMIVTPITLFLIIFPEQIILILLSSDFLPASLVLRIMALNAFFIVISRPIRTIFPGIDKPRLGASISITSNIINFGLNILLIPSSVFGITFMGLGEVGAAIATLSSSMILLSLCITYSKKVADATLYNRIPLHLFSGILSAAMFYLIELHLFNIVRIYHLVFYGLAFVGLYTLLLYLVGEFTKEDWNYILEAIHPKEMYDYIKDEVKDD